MEQGVNFELEVERYFLEFNFYVIFLEWLYGIWIKIIYKQCFLRDLFICYNIEV